MTMTMMARRMSSLFDLAYLQPSFGLVKVLSSKERLPSSIVDRSESRWMSSFYGTSGSTLNGRRPA